MCNDYERNVTWAQYRAAMRAADFTIDDRQSDLDMSQARDVRIGDAAPVARQSSKLVELVPMRFGMPPKKPHGSPLFNFRSEGRHFANCDRCLVIASANALPPAKKSKFGRREAPTRCRSRSTRTLA